MANVSNTLYCPECGGIECCDDDCSRAKRQMAQHKRREREKAGRAVIEAAKALAAWRAFEPGWPELLDDLRAAVEAHEACKIAHLAAEMRDAQLQKPPPQSRGGQDYGGREE